MKYKVIRCFSVEADKLAMVIENRLNELAAQNWLFRELTITSDRTAIIVMTRSVTATVTDSAQYLFGD